ncbi:MAG: membrane protein insertion efficiency factor YidD [Verrucomicrobiia bacterium]
MRQLLILLIRIYQVVSFPLKAASGGSCCRFTPTCSQYAIDALRTHSVLRALTLTLRRLGRCHPWGGWGYDPVPGATWQKAPLPQR